MHTWRPFTLGDTTYDLLHLRPQAIEYVVPATAMKPAIRFNVDVSYSTHCFTRGLPADGSSYDPALIYRDGREVRLFDLRRLALSMQLPEIIAGLLKQKCMHTGHGNFFTVAMIDEHGRQADYDIFFTVSKSSKKGRINLFIQSAFVRDKRKLPAGRPIRFEIVLYNTLNNRPFKA